MTDTCRLCPTAVSAIAEPAVHCFDATPFTKTTAHSIKYTVAEILNKHFWFELHAERDAHTVVCHTCWRKVVDFHWFYQSVLVLHQTRSSCLQPHSPPNWDEDVHGVDLKHDDDDGLSASDCHSSNSNDSVNPLAVFRQQTPPQIILKRSLHSTAQPNGSSSPPKRKRGRPRKCERNDFDSIATFVPDATSQHIEAWVCANVKHEHTNDECSSDRCCTKSAACCGQHRTDDSDNRPQRFPESTVDCVPEQPAFSTPAIRKRGRPRKSNLISRAAVINPAGISKPPVEIHGVGEPDQPITAPKRKRGRPRKSDQLDDASPESHNHSPAAAAAVTAVDDDLLAQFFTLQCDLCGEPLATLAAARAHHRQQHQQRGYLSCGCGRRYTRIDGLREHCAFHADASPYKCLQCCKIFSGEQRLLRHQTTMHGSVAGQASNELQPAAAAAMDSVAHGRLRQLHDDELLRRHIPLVCGECGCACESFAAFSQHHWQTHGRRGFLECCGRKFARKHRALLHCRRWHTNGEPFHGAIRHHMHGDSDRRPTISGYQCYRCHRLFKYASFLRHHLLDLHQTPDEYRFECVQCHRRIASLPALRRHQRRCTTAEGPPPARPPSEYVCDICGKVLRKKVSYEVHYAMEHSADGGESLRAQCPECGKWLKHYRRLGAHMLKHKATPVRCPDCGKMTPNRSAMHQHRRVMHREPAHRCTACGRMFRLLADMRKHMNVHTRAASVAHTHGPTAVAAAAKLKG